MSFFKKIQNLPEEKRKIILWSIVIIFSLVLFSLWFQILKQRLNQIEKEKIKEQLKIPQLEDKLKEIPKIEMPELKLPEISEEELKKIEEEEMKKIKEERKKEIEEMEKELE